MSEAILRQRLIRLSCAKLLALKKSSEGLRRSLHVLTVLKHAHSDEARFEPECSDLLRPKLIVVLEPAPIQRVTPVNPIAVNPPSQNEAPVDPTPEQIVPNADDETVDDVDTPMMEVTDEEDGSSMARKRKNHSNSPEYLEKRHHSSSSSSGGTSSSDGSASSPSSVKPLDGNNNSSVPN